ncbi:fungal-specific transcription factor domain-containing protein [Mycena sanguinolenta]|nr:fungal-specific transcription factor domain-containing protein [Mycena sanguinolenta]
MSSEDVDTIVVPVKKRRIQRACDACRQKRIRLDFSFGCKAFYSVLGTTKPKRNCYQSYWYLIVLAVRNQAFYGFLMTWLLTTACNDHDEKQELVTVCGRRRRNARIVWIMGWSAYSLGRLLPRLATPKGASQLTAERSHSPVATESGESSKHSPSINHKSVPSSVSDSSESLSPAVELAAMTIRALADRDAKSRDEDELVQEMENLHLRPHGKDFFLGKSSSAMLFQKALELKDEYYTTASLQGAPYASRRPEFWMPKPWEPGKPARPRYTFPPADLLSSLVELYFTHSAIYAPFLHRPSFFRSLEDNLHLRDEKFGAIVLCICAIGSRFSDDTRVFDAAKPLECGWQWFNQVGTGAQMNGIFESPKLFDIQRICLAIQFVEGSAQQGAWTLVGIGIRMAQEMGAHRRQPSQPHTLEAELWRRAFWLLVAYDRSLSAGMGRPCATHYYDFDVQMPTECDDEYWEHEDPAQAFCHPPGAPPSRVAFFNAYLRLSNILGFALHLLYSPPKLNNLAAVGDRGWDEQIVKELDSALNKWVDGIPEHLRWDPRRAGPVFFNQSVSLNTAYYLVQMTVHRLFIPMVRTAPTTLPSLAICTNAARSCSHVVDVWYQRMRHAPAVVLLPAVTTASLMLLLNVWSGKRTGLAPHMNTAIAEVQKCMRVVKLFETRWQAAGIFWDMLNELASVGQVPLPASPPPAEPTATNQRKRAHPEHDDDDAPLTQEPETTVESADPLALPIGFQDVSFQWSGALDAEGGSASVLPMYGEDLGRLPLFPPPPDYAFHPPVPPLGVEFPDWTKLPAPSLFPSSSSSSTGVTQGEISAEDVLSMIDNDVMALWSNAPTSLGAGDWSNYFDMMDSLNRETLL